MTDEQQIDLLVKNYHSIFQLGLAWKNAPDVGAWGVVSYQILLQLMFAKDCMERLDGDILEIGCRYGAHTIPFADLAAHYGRKVVAVDPYNGDQEGNQRVMEKFIENIGNRKNIFFYRAPSQNANLQEKIIKGYKICYVFIDGLHDDISCTSDVNFVEKCIEQFGLICIDDTNYLKDFHDKPGSGKSVRNIIENQKEIWEPLTYPNNVPLDSPIYQPVDVVNPRNEKSCHFFIKK